MIHDKLGFRIACGKINLLVHEFVNADDVNYLEQCEKAIIDSVDDIRKYKTREILGGVKSE